MNSSMGSSSKHSSSSSHRRRAAPPIPSEPPKLSSDSRKWDLEGGFDDGELDGLLACTEDDIAMLEQTQSIISIGFSLDSLSSLGSYSSLDYPESSFSSSFVGSVPANPVLATTPTRKSSFVSLASSADDEDDQEDDMPPSPKPLHLRNTGLTSAKHNRNDKYSLTSSEGSSYMSTASSFCYIDHNGDIRSVGTPDSYELIHLDTHDMEKVTPVRRESAIPRRFRDVNESLAQQRTLLQEMRSQTETSARRFRVNKVLY